MIAVDKKQKILWAIIAIFLLSKIFIAVQPHPAGWDESVYTGMGKHIYSAGGAGMWEEIRPPGLPLVLGAVWKTGLPFSFLAEMVMATFAAGTLVVTYLTSKEIFGNAAGIFSALMLAGTTLFFVQSSLFLTEVPSAFFATLALLLAVKNKPAHASIAAAAAAMFKFTNAIILPALLVAPLIEFARLRDFKKLAKKAAMTIWPFAAITVALMAFNYFHYGETSAAAVEPFALASLHQSNQVEPVSGLLENTFFYTNTLLRQNIFFLLFPMGVILIFKEMRKNAKAKMIVAYAVIYLLYLTAIPNKQERFALLFLPAAAIIGGYAAHRALLWRLGTTLTGRIMTAAIIAGAVLASATIITGDAAYVKERLAAETADYSNIKGGVVLSSEPYVAYYTDRKVVPYYFSTADGEKGIRKAVERYESNKEHPVIIYREQDFNCQDYDSFCIKSLEKVRP